MNNLPATGLSSKSAEVNRVSSDRKSHSTKDSHECDVNGKIYPQRHNRAKLNYRDLERGMYEEIYPTMQSRHHRSPALLTKRSKQSWNDDGNEHEVIDLSLDDDDETGDDHLQQRLSCLCQKPRDPSKRTLECQSCTRWYHEDCIRLTKEQARAWERSTNQFTCPSCRGVPSSLMKTTRSADESLLTKRKSSDRPSSSLSKSLSHDESFKRRKTEITNSRDSPKLSRQCVVHNCKHSRRTDWVYCSPACIRRHINDALQAIQRSKGNNEAIPTCDDILLYESKSKRTLEKEAMPKIEDLCTWLNQHPTFEIVPSHSQKFKDPTPSSSSSSLSVRKPKPTSTGTLTHQQSTNGRTTTSQQKSTTVTRQPKKSKPNITDPMVNIRSKVPVALYDKIIMRLEKSGELTLINDNIRSIAHQIEEEMFRVYGKVDNAYKNKFRSLLANISNMTNNFFYKQILSKAITAKQIVAMKAEDMLPPEEKEKRRDQFEREVQMIIKAEQQKAEELARRARNKAIEQNLMASSIGISMSQPKEQTPSNGGRKETRDDQSVHTLPSPAEKKPLDSNAKVEQLESVTQMPTTTLAENLPSISITKTMDVSLPPVLVRPSETSNQMRPVVVEDDSDNDYIEPESPTGMDALIYDEDDADEGSSNNIAMDSQTPIESGPVNSTEQQNCDRSIELEDYNPSKFQKQTSTVYPPAITARPRTRWRGVIHPTDIQIPCQSVHVYGDSSYLIGSIPEELAILGRLRLADLWDYIQESLAVRDVLILTLCSSSSKADENEIFSQYVDIIQTSRRAAVISKCLNASCIRDMYVLAADTKDCPASVSAALMLPTTFESKQLFLVIIGSGRKVARASTRSSENLSISTVTYKPIALQDLSITRDPRLARNRDPRLNRNGTTSDKPILITSQVIDTRPTPPQYTDEELLKLMSESLERIRRSSTVENIHSIITSTTELLQANRRDDLSATFTREYQSVVADWQRAHANTYGDNLTEENMDVVDDDQEEKQPTTSSRTGAEPDHFNDVDYRFLDPDTDHLVTPIIPANSHRRQPRKSRFSDLSPTDIYRFVKLKSPYDRHKIPLAKNDCPTETTNSASTQAVDNSITPSSNQKFQPNVTSTESCIPSTKTANRFFSRPLCFSFSKDLSRPNKTNSSLPKAARDETYERSSPVTFNSGAHEQKTRNRSFSSSNDWRCRHHLTDYHDLDQPEE